MKFELNGFNAYVISEHNGGYVINDCNGFLMTPEQMIEISRGLMLCAMQDEGEINAYNEKRKIEFEEQLHADNDKPKKEKDKGYVYLFECGGKYKIGLSRDVERRIRELDYRPFRINLITKSRLLADPFSVERELHARYEYLRLTGEWFALRTKEINEIKSYLNEV